MDSTRRQTIKSLLSWSGVGLAICSGILAPAKLLWAAWPKKAFQSTRMDEVMQNLFGTSDPQESELITIKMSRHVKSGNSIPIAISTTLEQVRSIAILIPNNNPILAAAFELTEGTEPYIASRIKMATSGQVYVMIHTAEGLYSSQRKIKVLHSYCVEGIE
jgi:sulfur-oxidizing protein SoxY